MYEHSSTKNKIKFVTLDILANFNGFKCPVYDFFYNSLECANVFMFNAYLIFG